MIERRFFVVPWLIIVTLTIVSVSSWISPIKQAQALASLFEGARSEIVGSIPTFQYMKETPAGCWPYRQYLPQVAAPHPATPTPVATGVVRWSRIVKVVAAHTTPAAPIPGAVVEARDLTYACCVTGPEGWCGVSLWAHDTHYVSIKASAAGYQSHNVGVPVMSRGGSITIPLEPEGD